MLSPRTTTSARSRRTASIGLALAVLATGGTVGAGSATAGPPSAAVSTATVTAAPSALSTLPMAITSTLRPGSRGPQVLELQRRLSSLGYWLGTANGTFGPLTTQAVYALQGAAGLSRDGVVGPATRAALAKGTRPTVRSTGRALEVDLARGLAIFVRDGRAFRILHTSTGTFTKYTHEGKSYLADTPRGSWRVSWRVNGVRDGELGEMYKPIYFHHDGIAVHGYGSVPPYPASHGCVRVTNAAIDMIWRERLMPSNMRVRVY